MNVLLTETFYCSQLFDSTNLSAQNWWGPVPHVPIRSGGPAIDMKRVRWGVWWHTTVIGCLVALQWMSQRPCVYNNFTLNIKLIYSEKATKNWRNLIQGLVGWYLVMLKPWGRFHQIFVAFSENMNWAWDFNASDIGIYLPILSRLG